MKKAILALFLFSAACSKQETPCPGPGTITIVSKGIVTWSNPTTVTIEVQGISWPGHALMTPNEIGQHRIEGHANVRIRTECSPWSDWYEINKP